MDSGVAPSYDCRGKGGADPLGELVHAGKKREQHDLNEYPEPQVPEDTAKNRRENGKQDAVLGLEFAVPPDRKKALRIGALRSAAAFLVQLIVVLLKLRVLDISGFPKMPG